MARRKQPSLEASWQDDFDYEAFRVAYPASRRIGGKTARQAYLRAVKGKSTEFRAQMLAALEQHKRSEQWQTPTFIPMLTTWLNQCRWEMELPAAKPKGVRECPHDPMCASRKDCVMRIINDGRRERGEALL